MRQERKLAIINNTTDIHIMSKIVPLMIALIASGAAFSFYYKSNSDSFFQETRRLPKPGCHQRYKMNEYKEKNK
jgi:hypothetical protein